MNTSFATATITTATTTNLYFVTATGTSASIGNVTYDSSGITPTAAFILGAQSQNLTLQGATTTIIATSSNSIVLNTSGNERMRVASGGQILINTTATSTGRVNIVGSTGAAVGVAGVYQESLLNTSSGGSFQFGNRHIVNVAPSASSSMDGEFVRMVDNTTLLNTVRAMELQAWSGTNVQGINTGLFSAGRTFGIQAVTNGSAGGISTPAALYGEITTSTQGQIMRLYSNVIASSSQDVAQFYQETSPFAGNGLKMYFAQNGGSFTGNFLDFVNNATSVFAVNYKGSVMIGTSTPYNVSNLVVCAQGNCVLPATTSTVAVFASDDGLTTGRSISAHGTITGQLADFGEYVPVEGNPGDYEVGDLLAVSSSSPTPRFRKTNNPYDSNLVGIVTDASAFIAGGSTNPASSVIMTLAGRVLAKVSGENGPIAVGDLITASSQAGTGMKAALTSRVVGIALEPFNGTSGNETGKIMVFVNPHKYYLPDTELLQGGSSADTSMNSFTFSATSTITVGTIEAGKVIAKNLEVGTSEAPTGVTLYDVKTKSPYCLVIEDGLPRSFLGRCEDFDFTAMFAPAVNSGGDTATTTDTEATATSTESGSETATSTEETATSTTTTEPIATSTEEITMSTEEVIIATSTEEIATSTESTATTTEPVVIEETATTTEDVATSTEETVVATSTEESTIVPEETVVTEESVATEEPTATSS